MRPLASLATLLAFAASCALAGCAASPKPQGAENAFVDAISRNLSARFPTTADARKAGYERYTNEDSTGAISYANLQWQSADPQHPSQLWYSVDGKLLGADYSVLQSASPQRPSLWGVDPRRWQNFDAHIHYVLAGSGENETYGYETVEKFAAAGGDVKAPSAATLVKMGGVKNAAQVERVFAFPSIWDLVVWVAPNPDGAFAEKNPLVKVSAGAKDTM